MKAQDIMTREVATVRPDASISAAISIMLDKHVSGMPVVDAGGHLVGILTEGDLLHRAETDTERTHSRLMDFILGPGRLATAYVQTHSRAIEDLMTREVATVDEDTPLEAVVELMESRHVKRVPVMHGETLVGIISRADLLRSLRQALDTAAARLPASDADIRDRIIAELDSKDWAPAGGIKVDVANGIVTLSGVIFDDPTRSACRVMAENIPGVKEVRDELTWVEPSSGMVIGPTNGA